MLDLPRSVTARFSGMCSRVADLDLAAAEREAARASARGDPARWELRGNQWGPPAVSVFG
jgi:hypothetical protein